MQEVDDCSASETNEAMCLSDVSLDQLGPTLDISSKFRSLCFSVTVAIETDFEVGAHCVRVLGVCGCDVYRLYVCVKCGVYCGGVRPVSNVRSILGGGGRSLP